MKRKPIKADPFSVWGPPPEPLGRLPKKHLATLRHYVESVTHKAYETGYDNGLVEGYTTVSLLAAAKLKQERNRMFRGRR